MNFCSLQEKIFFFDINITFYNDKTQTISKSKQLLRIPMCEIGFGDELFMQKERLSRKKLESKHENALES